MFLFPNLFLLFIIISFDNCAAVLIPGTGVSPYKIEFIFVFFIQLFYTHNEIEMLKKT